MIRVVGCGGRCCGSVRVAAHEYNIEGLRKAYYECNVDYCEFAHVDDEYTMEHKHKCANKF